MHHAKEAATVVKLVAMLDPKTGEPTKKSPRCLTAKQSAMLEVCNLSVNFFFLCVTLQKLPCMTMFCCNNLQVSLHYPVCVETFSESRALGRVFLRSSGRTVAMGKITRIIQDS